MPNVLELAYSYRIDTNNLAIFYLCLVVYGKTFSERTQIQALANFSYPDFLDPLIIWMYSCNSDTKL